MSLQHKIRPGLRCAILLRGKMRCGWCRKKLTKKSARLDHVVPREAGGWSRADNLIPACDGCNGARAVGLLGAILEALGTSLEAAGKRVMWELAQPVDRAAGRALADRWYPWSVAMRERDAEGARERRRKRREGSSEIDASFDFGRNVEEAAE